MTLKQNIYPTTYAVRARNTSNTSHLHGGAPTANGLCVKHVTQYQITSSIALLKNQDRNLLKVWEI